MTEALAHPEEALPKRVPYPSIKTLELWIREGLGLILDILEKKGGLKVRPKDLITYLHIRSKGTQTKLGRVLAILKEAGLAKRRNRGRPARYKLEPEELWRRYVEVCGKARFNCKEDGSPCGLIGICPYWRAIEYVRWCYGNGGRR